MKSRSSPFLAAVSALALFSQSTGAASIPAAMLLSAGTFPPSAARIGAFPKAALSLSPAPASEAAPAPAGPSWFDSARIVADFILSRAQEEFNPATPLPAPIRPAEAAGSEAVKTAAPAPSGDVVTPLNPGVDSPRDRMMVVMEPGRHVEAVIDENFREIPTPTAAAAPFPERTLPPFREKAIESNGVRARLSYIGSHGVLTAGPDGFSLRFPGAETLHARPMALPKAYRGDFPVYFPTEEIEISMTIENLTAKTLTGVTLEAVQETFRPDGTEGARILPPKILPAAASLAPGQKVVVHWRTRLMGPADRPVNLEQTHVRITGAGLASALIDAPQAGVVDPPGPGLL